MKLELVESVGEPARRWVREQVLVPDSEFGVISDLDDTVIVSHINDLLEAMVLVFGKGARSRSPFPGVPSLYRALERGPDDRGSNPIFYVSKSGWNLYDLLREFLDLHGIPRGPICLSDMRVIEAKSSALGSDRSKRESIEMLLGTYPGLPFILIGDSGQQDPELYREIALAHPDRIRAVYIHDVSSPERDQEVRRIAEDLRARGIEMLRAEDSLQAAEHAARQGYISRSGLEEVRREVLREQQP